MLFTVSATSLHSTISKLEGNRRSPVVVHLHIYTVLRSHRSRQRYRNNPKTVKRRPRRGHSTVHGSRTSLRQCFRQGPLWIRPYECILYLAAIILRTAVVDIDPSLIFSSGPDRLDKHLWRLITLGHCLARGSIQGSGRSGLERTRPEQAPVSCHVIRSNFMFT